MIHITFRRCGKRYHSDRSGSRFAAGSEGDNRVGAVAMMKNGNGSRSNRWRGWFWTNLDLLRRRRGFTLVELLIAVAIFAIIAAIAVPMLDESREAAKIAQAIGDIQNIQKEIDIFELGAERLPNSLEEVGRGDWTDPWDHPYVYSNFRLSPEEMRKDKNLKPINSSYDLYSMGKDGDSKLPLTAQVSRDDIVRASDGNFVGLAEDY